MFKNYNLSYKLTSLVGWLVDCDLMAVLTQIRSYSVFKEIDYFEEHYMQIKVRFQVWCLKINNGLTSKFIKMQVGGGGGKKLVANL